MTALLLDNEAVAALREPGHRKHRVVLAHLQAVVTRRRRRSDMRVLVATAVRVEVGWDRTDAGSAAINRFRIGDGPLDSPTANGAAAIVALTGLSVADAHTGALAQSLAGGDIVVLTSDPRDMVRAASPVAIRAVRI